MMAQVTFEMVIRCHPAEVQHFPLLENTIIIFLDWENIKDFRANAAFRQFSHTIINFDEKSLDIRNLRLRMIAANLVNLLVSFNYIIAKTVVLLNSWFDQGKEAQTSSLCSTICLSKWEVASVRPASRSISNMRILPSPLKKILNDFLQMLLIRQPLTVLHGLVSQISGWQ